MDATPVVPGAPPGPPRQSEAFAAAMLVLACLGWASFFSLGKNWQNAAGDSPGGELVSSLTMLGLRTVIALLALALVRPRLFLLPSRHEVRIGCWLGGLHCVGNILQVWGLASTSPALSGFLTSMASLWVPLLAYAVFRTRITGPTWLGLFLGLAGLCTLGINPDQPLGLGLGDSLTVLATVSFAFYILYLDRHGRSVRPAILTLLVIAVTGLPALFLGIVVTAVEGRFLDWLTWTKGMLTDAAVLRDLLVLTLLSTLLATHLMSTYQPRVSASRAALIYLLEPVFAALLSVIVGHDTVTGRLVLGGALILAGNALVELPLWLREFRKRRAEAPAVEPQ